MSVLHTILNTNYKSSTKNNMTNRISLNII